ncbi:MAG: DNA primase family protein [Peptococcales bacterium]
MNISTADLKLIKDFLKKEEKQVQNLDYFSLTTTSDLVFAQKFIEIHGNKVRYCHPYKKWLIFNGKQWVIDEEEKIHYLGLDVAKYYFELAQQQLKKETQDLNIVEKLGKIGIKLTNNRTIYQFVEAARRLPGVPIRPEELDQDIYKLNTKNCTIDLRDGRSLIHDSRDLITKMCNAEYRANAQCPTWLKFLDRIMDGNKELISYLQRVVGYSLTGDTSEHCLFMLYGTGRNGKSVFLNTILYVLGDYGKQAQPTILLERHNDNTSNDIAAIRGVRFAPTSEIAEGKNLAEAVVKQLTGGDEVVARFLYGEYFTFKPQAKIFLATNHKPIIKGTDIAIWERIHLIPFTVFIPEGERDKHLADKLKAEADGILLWAVEGCLAWQREGLNPPDIVRQAVKSYREEMDVLASFINECCTIASYAKVQSGQLYEKYQAWCKENGETPLNQRNFGLRLKERGFNNRRGTGGRTMWEGIGLKTQSPE